MDTATVPLIDAAVAPSLFEVLPTGIAFARWQHADYVLEPSLLDALAQTANHLAGARHRLLAIALSLVESRLTGAVSVIASEFNAGGLRQYLIEPATAKRLDGGYDVDAARTDSHLDGVAACAWLVIASGDGHGAAAMNAEIAAIASRWHWQTDRLAGLRVDFQAPYNKDAIDLWVDCVLHTLGALCSDASKPLREIEIYDAAQRQRLLVEWNATAQPRDALDTLPTLFRQEVLRSPAHIAIESAAGALSYAELDRRSDHVAAALQRLGIDHGMTIALMLPRSADAVVAMLGVLKAGAHYLPLDPGYPAQRLHDLLRDGAAALLIIDDAATSAPSGSLPLLRLRELEAEAATPRAFQGSGEDLAYVMYTSGSSGQPKGVQVPHRAIIRLVRQVDYVDLGTQPRILHAAPLGFDASTFEIWAALLNGGTCVIHHEALPSGAGLAATIARHRVGIAWLTAALFNAIVDDDPAALAGLSQLLTGGESLSPPHVRKALDALPATTIINGYGPTECTTFAATYRIPRDIDPRARAIPIGRPLADTRLYVLNHSGEPVPLGVLGELHIGGAGVALGYRGEAAIQANGRFLADPFDGTGLLYRSGDMVRWQSDGTLEFVGRNDGQVKIRGHRIELGEIEAALRRIDGVHACAVVAREDRGGQPRLVAYYVGAAVDGDARQLQQRLAQSLPEFMLPSVYIRLPRLPITANGKLDRRALPLPDSRRPAQAGPYVEARGELEQRLCQLFAEALGLQQIGRDDHFFEMGGHSLLAARSVARIQRELSPRLSVGDFFGAPTPAALAALIESDALGGVESARLAGPAAASCAEPIAIIAMHGRFPGAADVDTFWSNLCAGRESIRFFDDATLDPAVPASERDDPAYVAARGVLEGVELFDAGFFGMSSREAALTDPQQRLFLELCWECLERAGHRADQHQAPVGIFGGMHNASYFQRHLAGKPDLIDKLGAFQVMLANEKDYLATRVAHKLDLTGPAVSVNTACSTSLVAICQALDALRGGHCEMALAGGVSISCPPHSGYVSQEGSMLSPDGHTRSFDEAAQGTVFSDGAAVLLLKRLDHALRDGDQVHALILGGAVNNDGAAKASFTAPSSAGQAAVIRMALSRSGVSARSIGYVEAHGTATPLGDPIEIDGLRRAFQADTEELGFCAIGSLKSNVGHLVMAAGAAGVIKTALALQTGRLPPSLHFHAANPKLRLADSPFVVNASLRDWPSDGAPRRAGVSSFGVGGTNAHVILQQPPPLEASDAAAGPVLLLLSARSATALNSAGNALADWLQVHPAANLADVGWTLAVGRTPFAWRRAVVAEQPGEAARLCRQDSAPPSTPATGVIFMFPGQGAQYAGMGRGLYQTEPVFRQALDHCADLLRDELGFDLRQRLFAADADALKATALTQPAIFALEYSLARLALAHGLRPLAMIGHSVGEFVAAVIAQVMSLADAARLVARRGRLMQELDGGSMLSVRLAADELSARLPESLSLAAENAPKACVVAGEDEAVDAFQAQLERDGVACRRLQTSHAFHSRMMAPALESFRREVAAITLAPPQIPIASTLTGRTLRDDDATSIDYWTRHLREPVRFSPALLSLLAESRHGLLELGPRGVLCALARMHPASHGRLLVAALGDKPERESLGWKQALGELWRGGIELEPSALDPRTRKRRLCLPTYPFERSRHWIDADPSRPARLAGNADGAPASPALASVTERPMPTDSSPCAIPARSERLGVQLKALFEDVTGDAFADAPADTHFVEFGLDSLSLTQIALQLQRAFDLKITFRELMESCSSFGQLAAHIDRLLPVEAATAIAAAPAAPIASVEHRPIDMVSAGWTAEGPIQQLIQQQMLLMQQQLALLGAGAVTALPVATPAAVSTPIAAVTVAPSVPVDGVSPPDEETALAHTRYDVKKAFGAIARIHSSSTELSTRQRGRLDAFMRRYIERTRRSKDYTQQHRRHLADPRVVNGFRPLLKEIIYQIVVERSKGSRVWDLDGNEYIDALNGFGMNLFGWQPDFVVEALRRQIDAGYEIGPQHPLAGEVARQICALTGFDRAALCNTGSEAVMGTVRIARTVTGRDTLVIFNGSYHGIFDEVIVRGTRSLRSVPAAPGILRNTAENVLVLDYGTPESLAIIRERAGSIAAVLVEPVQSRRPEFQPLEFLRELRAITRDSGSLLIFDEVVTGFRAHPRGAQAVLGIDADLASYGKVVGGGFPIGVIAGKRSFMDALDGGDWRYGDASIPTVGVTYFAGTFVRHPLALAAADAVLRHLADAGAGLQERLNHRTAAFVAALNSFNQAVAAPIELHHFASVWKVNFLQDHPMQELLFAMMRSRGIHVLDNFPCFFTTAHSEADFVAIGEAYKASVLELQEADFLPRRRETESAALDASQPPVGGARLGRDPQGNPAWFVPHPETPGKFVRINA